MDELIFNSLDNYFSILCKTGYMKSSITESLVNIICLTELKDKIDE
mgnify:CR=1 FL=1